MSLPGQVTQRRALRSMLLCAMGALTLPAVAQQSAAPPEPSSKPPAAADNSTEKLIRLLVERKVLTAEDAAALLKEIRQAPAAQAEDSAEIRVPYIPENIQKKITEQLEKDVTDRARAENWAQPDSFPDWARHLRFFGDFRLREEADLYNKNNANTFINYQAINSGSPFDISTQDGNNSLPPLLNTTVNREQPRFRLRFGVTAQIDNGIETTFRFSSGNTTNPVSTNQTLGTDFNKYTFVIDQAYLDYHPVPALEAWLGRIPKPFESTNLVWWDDLSFDGLGGRIQTTQGPFTPFVNGGIFAVQNTALDFPTTSVTKLGSKDKWLLAGQLGLGIHFSDALQSTTAVALYDFHNIQGVPSAPCVTLTTSDACNTDDTVSAFMQRGNTLFPVRTVVEPQFPTAPQYELFGLAAPFHELDLVSRWDLRLTSQTHLVLTLDYVRNLAFNAAQIASIGPVTNLDANGAFSGGATGYQVQLLAGCPSIEAAWQWSVLGGYKHVDSDAVVDAFNDPDFFSINGVGGTNDKGYFIIGSLGLAKHTWASARWFSGTQVSGAPLAVDTFQFDISAGF